MIDYDSRLLGWWVNYLETLAWIPGENDTSCYKAFLRAASLDINPDFALTEVLRQVTESGGKVREGKILHQRDSAYYYVAHQDQSTGTKTAQPKFRPGKLARLADRTKDTIDPNWLLARSTIDPQRIAPAEFLHHLYLPGEKVLIFDSVENQGSAFWTHDGYNKPPSGLDRFKEGKPHGVWFLINPVIGKWIFNQELGHRSLRSWKNLAAYRYAVIESDKAPADLWLKAIVQLPLRIAAIYSSAKRSIHVLFRVDAADIAAWNRTVRESALRMLLVELGGDDRSLRAVQLSRLPGCQRGETGRVQQLFYLDPKPSGAPIVTHQPVHRG